MSSPLKNRGMSLGLTNLSPGLLSTIGGAVYLGYGLKGPGVKLIPYIGVDDEKEDSTLLAKLEPRSETGRVPGTHVSFRYIKDTLRSGVKQLGTIAQIS